MSVVSEEEFVRRFKTLYTEAERRENLISIEVEAESIYSMLRDLGCSVVDAVRLKRIKMLIETFPKPWVSTDYTPFFDEDMDALDKGEPLPEHDNYPQYYNEPEYETVKKWFEELRKEVLGK